MTFTAPPRSGSQDRPERNCGGVDNRAAAFSHIRATYPMKRRARDERLLLILHLRDAGWTSRQIADHVGMTSSGVRGIVSNVLRAGAACACLKPENRDGGMPTMWWSE